MLAISDRVVIRADDLLNWCDDTINWTYGLRATTMAQPKPASDTKVTTDDDQKPNETIKNENLSATEHNLPSNVRSLRNSKLDFSEVEKEKGN